MRAIVVSGSLPLLIETYKKRICKDSFLPVLWSKLPLKATQYCVLLMQPFAMRLLAEHLLQTYCLFKQKKYQNQMTYLFFD